MCAICGIYSVDQQAHRHVNDVHIMNHVLRHRGPDDEGIYVSDACVLGHRRLSIIDLSSNGHQPFVSDDGNYVLAYNGEIYNYIELREYLISKGVPFRTRTDTEVLLKMYIIHGRDCLPMLNGMFAFAIYDKAKQELFLARDRMGIKPLYYIRGERNVIFASEIKALKAVTKRKLTVNEQAVFDFLCFNRTDIFDETFYKEIVRLPKGHYATLARDGMCVRKWWDPETFLSNSIDHDHPKITRTIQDILVSSVKLRMRSDVPVGSCLSGGLDSSILVGIIHEHCQSFNGEYKTFTASFPGHPLDETRYVDALSKVMRFSNYRTYPSAELALEHFPAFSYTNDEPVAGPAFYSQYEVMRLARQHNITVVIDGQGGDENFAGYQYFHGFYLYGLLKTLRIGTLAAEIMRTILRRQHHSAYATLLFQLMPRTLKKHVLMAQAQLVNRDFFHAHIDSSRIFNDFFDADDLNTSLVRHFQYKLEHLLRTEDRNSMAFAIEARVPYLDYRLVEFLLSVPERFKIHAGQTKYLQKVALGHYTIPAILARKDKIGFGTPVEDWMRTPAWEARYADALQTLAHTGQFVNTKIAPGSVSAQDKWKICSLHQCIAYN